MLVITIAAWAAIAVPDGARCLAIADHLDGVTVAARRTFGAQFGLSPDLNALPVAARQRAIDIAQTERLVGRIRARYPDGREGSADDLAGAQFAAWVRAGRACIGE